MEENNSTTAEQFVKSFDLLLFKTNKTHKLSKQIHKHPLCEQYQIKS